MTATTNINDSNPYVVPDATNDTPGLFNAAGGIIFETTIITSLATNVNPIVSGTTDIHAETYNGTIPGPTFRLTVGDTVIVRLVNNLPYPTGIHWHGIELTNSADGTPVTQDGALGAPLQILGDGTPAGGTYLYKFTVPRPGIFWYHPHHFHSTNRVFRGLYGMIIVSNTNEDSLVEKNGIPNTLPSEDNTIPLVLSDITVCKGPGLNDPATYVLPATPADAEWLSGLTAQLGPTQQLGPRPTVLCDTPLNEEGVIAGAPLVAGTVPNIQRKVPNQGTPPTVEGQTVLTNGVNVGWREGKPNSPGTLDLNAYTLTVQRGQGLRLQIVNCATTRYFRLLLTTEAGVPVALVRVGGEGGLLNKAVEEGGSIVVGGNNFDTKYESGEILIPPASRADVVAVIPANEPDAPDNSVLTLWTRDFPRTGGGFSNIPTVPVMHLKVNGDAATTYSIIGGDGNTSGTELLVNNLTFFSTAGGLLDPNSFTGPGGSKTGTSVPIKLTASFNLGPSINSVHGDFPPVPPSGSYTSAVHINSSRYALHGDHLQLTVENTTNAHHPFHLHGFSFQPISLTQHPTLGDFTWLYPEFRDNVDIPSGYTLKFAVRLDDRALADEITPGGALGRWLFHCHIFFHAHQGMISELVVTDAGVKEKPNVDVGGSWAYAAVGQPAERSGTFFHRDGLNMTLTPSVDDGSSPGVVTPNVLSPGGPWSWKSTPGAAETKYVYITAEDTDGRKDQTVFRLQIGGNDQGSDNGDPHIHTVDGKTYQFQAAGEFTVLRDREGMEIQARQTPVATANPFPDSHSGLISCVSINTAVAARVGSHRIAYQQGREEGRPQFFLDGKPTRLPTGGIDLGAHRVSAFDVGNATGLRVDYAQGAVLTVTPHFWSPNKVWYMNVSISHTQGNEGIMGPIPNGSWLPTLPSGATVGPKPASLHDRYIALYKTFANAWRLTDQTSLFVYAPGTSTATFTDVDWPAEKPPCEMKPQFKVPELPTPVNIPVEEAELICQAVTMPGLHADCVFDVATTGDKIFAEGYLEAQDLALNSTTVQIVGDKGATQPGKTLVVTAIVIPMTSDRPTPTGSVTFLVNGVAAGRPVKLDEKGRASRTLDGLDAGEHKIRAAYTSDDGTDSYHPSSSPNLLHTAGKGLVSPDEPSFGFWHKIWIWIILILILIAIALYAYFS